MILPALLVCTVVLSGQSGYRQQYPLPSTTVSDGWGVNIHFTDPAPGEMEMIAKAGFKWVRMDFFWHQIETKKGVYDFSAYDRLMAALRKQKIRPVFILDYGNDLYQQGSPREPQSVQGFCNFVKAAVTHYKGQGVLWEMWNEPNIFFWQPKPDVKQYIALALEVGKTIRNEAPDEWYVGPATSGIDFSFLDACFKAGLLKYWDAVTVHPYRTANPETVVGEWAKLRTLVDQYAPAKRIPLMSGEWGYSEKYSGLDLAKQSQYIARQYLTNLSCGVGLSIWYDWKDDGTDPKEPEHHFGTVYNDLKPKPTYESAATLVETLKDCTFVMRLRQSDPSDWLLIFKDPRGKGKAIGWTAGSDSKNSLGLEAIPKPVGTDMLPSSYVDRACRFIKLPETAKLENAKDASKLLKPLVENLLAGETLAVYDTKPQESLTDKKPIYLDKGDLPNLDKVLGKLERLSDVITPVHILTVSLSTPGSPEIVQTCDLTRDIISFEVVGYENNTLKLQVNNQRNAFSGYLRPMGSNGEYQLRFKSGVETQHLLRFDDHYGIYGLKNNFEMYVMDSRRQSIGSIFEKDVYAFPSISSGEWEAALEGDEKVGGSASARIVDRLVSSLSKKALGVTYSFDLGWKYLALRNSERLKTDLPGKPLSLTMAVKGDGSGCALKVRLIDSTGQTHQIDGMDMNWTDSRFVTFDLTKIAVSWGGKNDGIVHYPVRFDTVLLVDGKGKASKGYIEVSDLVVRSITLPILKPNP